MAGVIVYVGIFHLTIYFQRLDRRGDLTFALICFGMALYDISCVGLYNVTSVADGLNWQRIQVFVLLLTGVLFLWFIADYTSQRSRIWIYSFTGFFLVTALILLIDRSGLAFSTGHPLIKKISLPLGLNVTYFEAAPGPLTGLLIVAGLLLLVYTLRLIIKYYRSGNRKKAIPLFWAIFILFVGLWNDFAVSSGLYEFIYALEYSYLGIVLVIEYFLARDIVEAAVTKEALKFSEEKYRKLSGELEHRVARRTRQLAVFNEELQIEITGRKRIEEALKESELRYKQLLNHAPAGIYEVDFQTGKLVSVNDVMCEYTGYSREELLSMSAMDFLSEESQSKFVERLGKIFAGEEVPETVEYKARGKNGQEFWALVNAKYIYENETPKGATVVVHDITERKRAEAEKEKLKAQLHDAQKMEAIGTLAGGVAHDLNNILPGIVSYPELILLDLPFESPLREPILTMKKSGEKATTIVQDLLTLARRGVATTDVVNITQIISDYLHSHEYQQLLKYHPEVVVETALETDIMNIMGSPVHLSKAIMNLVSNAAEAMPAGGAMLISAENRYIDRPVNDDAEMKEGDYVIIKVSDTGVGISSDDMKRIFEPFYTKKVMGRSGTGLGMAVVWGTVKDHKGYIDIQSIEGQGTTFTLYFPATRNELKISDSHNSLEEFMGHGESILVIDDVNQQREIATKMLNRLSYSVKSVSSGEEAVAYVKNNTVDLLLLDMIMDPGINGLETYKRIVNLHPEQKAIIASGYAESTDVKKTQKLGARVYLKKPYTLERLGNAVRNELNA
jgi:PAS domain S-box-containing protein